MECQTYHIRLINGEILEASEPAGLPLPKRLSYQYKACMPDEILTVEGRLGQFLIPWRNVIYLSVIKGDS